MMMFRMNPGMGEDMERFVRAGDKEVHRHKGDDKKIKKD